MDYDLEPCPHCRLENARLKRFDEDNTLGNCLVAVFCSGCGARGPVRHISPFAHVDAVMALAADDWNMGGQEGQIEHKVENMPLRIEALDDVLAAKESESEPATDLPAQRGRFPQGSNQAEEETDDSAEPPQAPEAAGGGGAEGATKSTESRAPDGSPRHPIADRIEAYLERTAQSVWAGLFSVSDQTVHNILHGSKPKAPTIEKLVRELDKLERDEMLANQPIDPSKIERLPNRYDELNAGNPLPKHEAPARCARTP